MCSFMFEKFWTKSLYSKENHTIKDTLVSFSPVVFAQIISI